VAALRCCSACKRDDFVLVYSNPSARPTLGCSIKSRMAALARPVDSLDALRFAMSTLAAIRAKEASIENDVTPIMEMYALLEHHLHPASSASAAQGSSGHGVSGAAATGSSKTGSGIGISKEEMDQKSVLRSSWRKLLDRSVEVATHIASCQAAFKKRLLSDVRAFSAEIAAFRVDYAANGPMVDGLPPNEALERLRRYQDDFELRQRKRELYNGGEALFALHQTPFSELDEMGRELQLLDKLYSLYRDVMTRMEVRALPCCSAGVMQCMFLAMSAIARRCFMPAGMAIATLVRDGGAHR